MSKVEDSEVLKLLQPDLLTTSDLITIIKNRCPRLSNVETNSKDRLVKLFREIILPLPQRLYRANRRGKILTARRIKSGLESKAETGKEEKRSFHASEKNNGKRSISSDDRLKPPPDSSRRSKIRINSDDTDDLDKIVINDRRSREECEKVRKPEESRRGGHKSESYSSKKVILKRPSSSRERSSPSSESSSPKKSRSEIKWP